MKRENYGKGFTYRSFLNATSVGDRRKNEFSNNEMENLLDLDENLSHVAHLKSRHKKIFRELSARIAEGVEKGKFTSVQRETLLEMLQNAENGNGLWAVCHLGVRYTFPEE